MRNCEYFAICVQSTIAAVRRELELIDDATAVTFASGSLMGAASGWSSVRARLAASSGSTAAGASAASVVSVRHL